MERSSLKRRSLREMLGPGMRDYGHGPFGVNFHEVSIGLFSAQYLQFFLQIRMLLRLIPELGGDGTIYGIVVLNDITTLLAGGRQKVQHCVCDVAELV
jgi:hypothetical protein